MSKYELMYIIDSSLEETARKELIDRFTKLLVDIGGELEKIDEWGKRRLAYPIDYKNEGYYVLMNFSAGPSVPREMERNLQISENVLRYLIVKLEQKSTSVKPRPVPVRAAAPSPIVAQAAETADEAENVAEEESEA